MTWLVHARMKHGGRETERGREGVVGEGGVSRKNANFSFLRRIRARSSGRCTSRCCRAVVQKSSTCVSTWKKHQTAGGPRSIGWKKYEPEDDR